MIDVALLGASDDQVSSLLTYLETNDRAYAYHHPEWLKAVKDAYGFDYKYFVARDQEKLLGVLPLCFFSGFGRKKLLISVPYADLGGVVADSSAARQALEEAMFSLLDRPEFVAAELRQSATGSVKEADFAGRKVRMLLELPESADTLFSGFKAKLRSQVRKAGKNGLAFRIGGESDLGRFYKVYSRNMRDLGSPAHSAEWFGCLKRHYGGRMVVGIVSLGSTDIGAGILLTSGNNVSIPWASTLREYNRLAPNMLLYWNLLRISCEEGRKVFDFGRSTYGEGTYRFKLQWGARPELLEWAGFAGDGRKAEPALSEPGTLREIVESVWRRLPVGLANRVGPVLRRRISL